MTDTPTPEEEEAWNVLTNQQKTNMKPDHVTETLKNEHGTCKQDLQVEHDELIEMAREAGLWTERASVEMALGGIGELERFAELVRAKEREKHSDLLEALKMMMRMICLDILVKVYYFY